MDTLEQTSNIEHWRVDLNNPNYLLTVESSAMTAQKVHSVIQNAGFKAQLVSA